jgi:hypothetical protein
VREKPDIGVASDKIIDCLIIYPFLEETSENKQLENFTLKCISETMLMKGNPIKVYNKVYKLGVSLPMIG